MEERENVAQKRGKSGGKGGNVREDKRLKEEERQCQMRSRRRCGIKESKEGEREGGEGEDRKRGKVIRKI